MDWRAVAGLGAAIVLLATCVVVETAVADDFKEITTAAYCVGVIKTNIDLGHRDFPKLDYRSDEQNLAFKAAFVAGALKQKMIDIETVTRLNSVGSNDAHLCWEASKTCASRLNTPLADPNSLEWKGCMLSAQSGCDRIARCN